MVRPVLRADPRANSSSLVARISCISAYLCWLADMQGRRRRRDHSEDLGAQRHAAPDGLQPSIEQVLKLKQQLQEEVEVARVFAAHFTAVSTTKRQQLEAAGAQLRELQVRLDGNTPTACTVALAALLPPQPPEWRSASCRAGSRRWRHTQRGQPSKRQASAGAQAVS